jgi:hypothetical protein
MLERDRDVVELHDIDVSSLKQLIDYAYTGEITITEENVQVLLPVSSLLQIQSVREACCKFLLRQLHPSNCLGIRSFAGKLTKFLIHLPLILDHSTEKLLLIFPFSLAYRRSFMQRITFKVTKKAATSHTSLNLFEFH